MTISRNKRIMSTHSLSGLPRSLVTPGILLPCIVSFLLGPLLQSSFAGGQSVTGAHRRFEYKLSFKGPNLVQRDGTIPFWQHVGHAIASDESVRITPSLKSKKGAVWAKEINPNENWEVEVVFRINGRGRIGADGLAFWYTEQRAQEGPVFGSMDNWNGLGVFFDSFDNDNARNNPYVMAMVNDGTKTYAHETDGSSQQLSGCQRDFRNKPFPTRAKIEYYKKALTIFLHNGLTNNRDDFELCMRVEGLELPMNGYFGVSAATGDLADDHDVLAFLTHSLTPPSDQQPGVGQQVPEDDRKKFEQEFDRYQDKLEKAKEDYKKDHPAKPGVYEEDDDKMYDAQDVKELRMIFDGQNAIHQVMRTLALKLDEVVGRQERELSMLSLISSRPPGQGHADASAGSAQQLPAGGINPLQRHEVDTMLASHRDLASSVRDVRTLLNDVQTRVTALSTGGAQHGAAAAAGGGDVSRQLTDVKTFMTSIQNDVRSLLSKPQTSGESGKAGDCVTTSYLLVFLTVQLGCIIGFLVYRSSKEAAAKKFY